MKKALLLFGLLMASPSIFAGGVYFGAGLGTTKADDAESNVNKIKERLAAAGATSEISYHIQANAASLAIGYHVNDNIDAEIGYDYLGTYDLVATIKVAGTKYGIVERNMVSAVSLAGIFSANISDKISIHARAGLAATNNKSTCQSSFSSSCEGDSDSGAGALFGIGGAFKPSTRNAFRLDYIQFSDVGNKNNEYTAGAFSTIKIAYIFTP